MSDLTLEIISDSEQGGFTARVPDIPAYGEGDAEEQAIADLREALTAYIEVFGLADAMARPKSSQLSAKLARLTGGEMVRFLQSYRFAIEEAIM
jgi:predicted RNase H-like HicB family nuclease